MITPYLTYFTHVLPLDYDLSLTPYEIISKLLKWLDGLTTTVNSDTAAITDLQQRVADLEERGFTEEQLRTVLDEMVANGDFDFLIDLIASKTELWDTVGLKPFGQVLPEKAGVNIAGYGFQSMAIGEIGGVKVGFFCFAHETNDVEDGSLAMTYNMTNGELIGYSTTYSGHMNGCAFNPNDEQFYVTPGGTWNKIVVYDYQCNITAEINSTDASYKAGGIAFNRTTGNAYITWYSADSSDATIIINEVEGLENRTAIDSTVYSKTYTWDRGQISAIGRQDIYCDDVFLYLPTYWHQESSLYRGTYNKQDVFKLSDLEYVRTQYINTRQEVNGGECFDGEYYIAVNIAQSGYIFKAAVRCDNAFNNAYKELAQMSNSEYNYGPFTLYGDASTTNLLADGSLEYPINRFAAMQLISPAYNRYSGIRYYLTGDFTVNDQITNISINDSKQRLILSGVTNCILPKLTLNNCDRVAINDLTINSYDSNYTLYTYDTEFCLLDTVTFAPQSTVASVISIDNSKVEFASCEISGSAFTKALTVGKMSRAKGRLYYDGSNTRIGEYALDANTAIVTDQGSYLIMTDNGVYIHSKLLTTAAVTAEDILLQLDGSYKVDWTMDRITLPTNPYLADGKVYFDNTSKQIVAAEAIESGVTLTIVGLIPIGTLSV